MPLSIDTSSNQSSFLPPLSSSTRVGKAKESPTVFAPYSDIELAPKTASNALSSSSVSAAVPHSLTSSQQVPMSASFQFTNDLSRVILFCRRRSKPLTFALVFVFLLFMLHDDGSSGGTSPQSRLRGQLLNIGSSATSRFGGASSPGAFLPPVVGPSSNGVYHLAAIADLDQKSSVRPPSSDAVVDSSPPVDFYSVLRPGELRRVAGGRYALTWSDGRVVTSRHNEAGRGMELSELLLFDDRLLTFDDRTGIVFELLKAKDKGKAPDAVPRFVITEGQGDTDKGMKIEWATVKDGNLYIGSFGKEYTNKQGQVVNRNNLWITVLDNKGRVTRYDWGAQYDKMRVALGCESPGYLVHEAIHWSEHQRRWLILPRRVSKDAYDDALDESKGSNVLLVATDNFSQVKAVYVKIPPSELKDGLHGFSSFAFVPGTKDRHAVALRSVEERCTGDISLCKQRTYAMVFDTVTGDVLMDEQIMSSEFKFEGIAFVNVD